MMTTNEDTSKMSLKGLLSLEIYSRLSVSSGDWFQNPALPPPLPPQRIPTSKDALVPYINGVVFACNLRTSSCLLHIIYLMQCKYYVNSC